jgi:phosphoribosylaminoimidazolecarboxamide formyltransferase/IMP cyclohydrolase
VVSYLENGKRRPQIKNGEIIVRRIERALISVHDKRGVVDFARGLRDLGVEILSTGGTFKLLSSNGIPVREVSDYTGFPEILDGRVKTLNPLIAGGLLAIRSNAEHMRQTAGHGVQLIDLVCVNLYPFGQTIGKPGVEFDEVIENIDIGGPSMIRAAAKNFQDVAVVTSPDDYESVLAALRRGSGILDRETLFGLARKAFVCSARYDGEIAQHLSQISGHSGIAPPAANFPANLFMDFEKVADLRYGENPHQKASFYRWGNQPEQGLAAARQLQGKELSYNNIVDLEAAWNLILEFEEPACCVIKHTNPCGTAIGTSLREAYLKAYETDPISAFGSVIAVNRSVGADTATELAKLFVEAVIAPGYDSEAAKILSAKKNLRLISMGLPEATMPGTRFEMKRVTGGILVQESDNVSLGPELRQVTRREPTEKERTDLYFAWRVAKHVKSNAIVLAEGGRTIGVGAGQMSRVDSVKLSIQKANPGAKGAVMGSDAFFPFRDGIDEAARAGVTAVIQPGGSVRDNEVIQAADEHGMAMIFTGLRHFKH